MGAVALWVLIGCLSPVAAAAERLAPSDVFTNSDGGIVIAPGTQLGSGVLLVNTSSQTVEQCSAACSNNTRCAWFEYCDKTSGCNRTQPVLRYRECHLFDADCQAVEYTEVTQHSLLRVTGFPLRYTPAPVPGYSARAAQGVDDGSVECPGTAVPGKCAFPSLLDATLVCAGSSQCAGVVMYYRGLDGCSASVAVLVVSTASSEASSFVSPNVATYIKQNETLVLETSALAPSEGAVLLPPADELAAVAANGSSSSRTAWLGCIVAESAVMAGEVLGVMDGVSSAEACCRACRANPRCTAWNFCKQAGGCRFNASSPSPEPAAVQLKEGQCEMRYQGLASPSAGFALRVKAKGPGVQFVGGAPISATGPAISGFTLLVGRLPQDTKPNSCNETLIPALDQCILGMPLQGLASYCQASASCEAVVVKSGFAGQQPGSAIGFIKSNLSSTPTVLAPAALLYVKDDSSGSSQAPAASAGSGGSSEGSSSSSDGGGGGGLSAGVIAGTAVGAGMAAAVLAAAVYLQLQRRRGLTARLGGPKVGAATGGGGIAGDGGTAGLKLMEDGESWQGSAFLGCCSSLCGTPQPSTTSAGTLSTWSNAVNTPAAQPGNTSGGSHGPASNGSSVQSGGAHLAEAHASSSSGGSTFQSQRTIRVAPPAPSPFAAAAASPFAPAASAPFRAAAAAAAATAPSPFAGDASAPFKQQALQALLSLTSAQTPSGEEALAVTSLGAAAAGVEAAPDGTRLEPLPPAAVREQSPGGSVSASGPLPGQQQGQEQQSQQRQQQGQQQSNDQPLQELQQHVEAVDLLAASAILDDGSLPAPALGGLVSAASLPTTLKEWVVDMQAVTYLRWANGRVQELGQGASGRVVKALYLGETIAVKEIDLGRSAEVQRQFVQEALRLHQLRHPHVVGLYGVSISGSLGVLLLEYCGGRDLYKALSLQAAGSSERLFGWRRRGWRVAYEVAKALNFLHAKGVVHMDVKSSNVLLTSTGTAKLADVGLARLQTHTYLSEVDVVGTFAWIAPEVLMGSPNCTTAVDLYSYGVLLWEIITGERPKRGALRLPRVPEECPQAVSDLMLQCLSQEPSKRPTALQVVQQLEGMQ